MRLPPAVIVHGRADIDAVLAHGRPVTLLSAVGAGAYAGCLWWQALMAHVRAAHPFAAHPLAGAAGSDPAVVDLLDCADASGQALAALRIGLRGLVLAAEAPGHARVAAIAAAEGAVLLATPPEALDMAIYGAARRLHDWLQSRPGPGDSRDRLG